MSKEVADQHQRDLIRFTGVTEADGSVLKLCTQVTARRVTDRPAKRRLDVSDSPAHNTRSAKQLRASSSSSMGDGPRKRRKADSKLRPAHSARSAKRLRASSHSSMGDGPRKQRKADDELSQAVSTMDESVSAMWMNQLRHVSHMAADMYPMMQLPGSELRWTSLISDGQVHNTYSAKQLWASSSSSIGDGPASRHSSSDATAETVGSPGAADSHYPESAATLWRP